MALRAITTYYCATDPTQEAESAPQSSQNVVACVLLPLSRLLEWRLFYYIIAILSKYGCPASTVLPIPSYLTPGRARHLTMGPARRLLKLV